MTLPPYLNIHHGYKYVPNIVRSVFTNPGTQRLLAASTRRFEAVTTPVFSRLDPVPQHMKQIAVRAHCKHKNNYYGIASSSAVSSLLSICEYHIPWCCIRGDHPLRSWRSAAFPLPSIFALALVLGMEQVL